MTTGLRANQICAFARFHEDDVLIVAVSRFPVRFEADHDWTGTEISWPQAASIGTHWRDLLGGCIIQRHGEGVDVGTLLEGMPVAVLVPNDRSHR